MGRKSKSLVPPPNQSSIKMFISGGSVGWEAGDSPVIDNVIGEGTEFEIEIHQKILNAGTFKFFLNQHAALAYLNGQLVLRKDHLKKIERLEKSLVAFKTSGLTKRFMRIPVKSLPNDKYHCERELNRAALTYDEMVRFLSELVSLKTDCLDDIQAVKPKKSEEYSYFDTVIEKIKSLSTEMKSIRQSLYKTNLVINQSKGVYGALSSVLENKRKMRRLKEHTKVENRKAFKRSVKSLELFLSKYTSKKFEEVFKIVEKTEKVSANHHGKTRTKTKAEGSLVDDHEIDDGELSILDTPVECEIDVVEDLNSNQLHAEVDKSSYSKPRYQHFKIKKEILLLNGQLAHDDFLSFNFKKQDRKGLALLKSISALDSKSLKVVNTLMSEWSLDCSSNLDLGDDIEDKIDDMDNEVEEHITVESEGEEQQLVGKERKKKYKSIIRELLGDCEKMKIKKLRKQCIAMVATFDNRDEEARVNSFEKYIKKMDGVVIVGKYVFVN